MYSTVVQYFYIIESYNNTTILSVPYIISSWLIYLITCILDLLIPFTHPSPLPLWQPLVCSLYPCFFCLVIFVPLFCFLDCTNKWKHIVFVFLSHNLEIVVRIWIWTGLYWFLPSNNKHPEKADHLLLSMGASNIYVLDTS